MCQGGTELKERDVIKVGGGRVQKHRWKQLAYLGFLKRKDDISSTNRGNRSSGQPSAKLLRGVVIWKHSNAPPLRSQGMLCIPLSPHLSHYMEIFSSCVFLFPTMWLATWYCNARGFWRIWTLQSYCCLSWQAIHCLLPALTFTRYLCPASHLTVLQFYSLGGMGLSQLSSHRTAERTKWDNLCKVPGILPITY